MSYLPAEWHKQSLIQLTWPHKDTDWAYMLDEVNDCFLKIAYEVLKRQSLLIVAPDPDSIRDSIDNYGADIQNRKCVCRHCEIGRASCRERV